MKKLFKQLADLNKSDIIVNLLSFLLSDKTTVASIELKMELDRKFDEVMIERLEQAKADIEKINIYLKSV